MRSSSALDPLAREGRHRDAVEALDESAERDASASSRSTLLSDDDGRPLHELELAEQRVHRRHLLVERGVARVDHVQQHVGLGQLLERRLEGRHELMRAACG